jgi:Hg(II)-responsive transcriptional regulator
MPQFTRLTTGRMAKLAGVNVETLRYYERRGLLRAATRTVNGFRIFSQDELRRLRFIKRAQTLGFSLDEIEALLSLRVDGSGACTRVRHQAEAKIVEIDEKLKTLRRMKNALSSLVRTCERKGTTSYCPILDSLEEQPFATRRAE